MFFLKRDFNNNSNDVLYLSKRESTIDNMKMIKSNKESRLNAKTKKFIIFDSQKLLERVKKLFQLKQLSHMAGFSQSAREHVHDEIGLLHYSGHISDRIKNRKFKIHSGYYSCNDMCPLPDGTILFASYHDSELRLYDKDFKLKERSVLSISPIKCMAVTVSSLLNRVYICNFSNSTLLVTDLSFEVISTQICRDPITDRSYFPTSICCHKTHLYICDRANCRVAKLNAISLVFEDSYRLHYSPSQIQISDHTACVRPSNETAIFFYDLQYFNLKYKYDDHRGTICKINNQYYEFDHRNHLFYCYNEMGQLEETILLDTECFPNIEFALYNPCITYYNGKLILYPGCNILIEI